MSKANVVNKVRLNKRAEFEAEFSAPSAFGVHEIVLRDARSGRIIDGTMFSVGHSDSEKVDVRVELS